jgi:hypothetical protein
MDIPGISRLYKSRLIVGLSSGYPRDIFGISCSLPWPGLGVKEEMKFFSKSEDERLYRGNSSGKKV